MVLHDVVVATLRRQVTARWAPTAKRWICFNHWIALDGRRLNVTMGVAPVLEHAQQLAADRSIAWIKRVRAPGLAQRMPQLMQFIALNALLTHARYRWRRVGLAVVLTLTVRLRDGRRLAASATGVDQRANIERVCEGVRRQIES